jgi:SOS-response transcriptional repressor LexA
MGVSAVSLTKRGIDVLQIIERSLAERGFPPTYAELTIGLGINPSSRQAVREHIARLESRGLLVVHAKIARGIALTAAARELLARLRAQQGSNEK